jgi:hypothetical protein
MKILIPILICLAFSNAAISQESHWTHPDFVEAQYAGSIGYISGGAGYDILRNRARVSLHFGHVPKWKGGTMNIFATKFLYVPAVYQISEKAVIHPFDFGMMVSYHLGSDFRSRWPSHRYPESYYWWQTSFRFHFNFQPSVSILIRDHTVFKTLTAFLDINANELYLISMFQNTKTIRPYDAFKLGAGIRLHY